MYRTTSSQNDETGSIYVTYLESDRNMYRTPYVRERDKAETSYETSYTINEDLNIPSRKTLAKTIMDIIRSDDNVLEQACRKYVDMLGKNMAGANYDKVVNDPNWKIYIDTTLTNMLNNYKSTMNDPRMDISAYYAAASVFGTYPEFKEKVITELKSQGYNAMTDEAGVGGQFSYATWSKFSKEGLDPLIVFDRSIMTKTSQTELSRKDERKALKKVEKDRRMWGGTVYGQWSEEM